MISLSSMPTSDPGPAGFSLFWECGFSSGQLLHWALLCAYMRRWSFGWVQIFIFLFRWVDLGNYCFPLFGSAYPSPVACSKLQSEESLYQLFRHWCWLFLFLRIEGLVWRARPVCGTIGALCRLHVINPEYKQFYFNQIHMTNRVGRVLGFSWRFKVHSGFLFYKT